MKSKGFTLIEMLIALTIIAVLGLIFISFLIQTLRGQKKVQVINQAKQNGQVILDQIAGQIRQSDYVVCTKGVSVVGWDTLVLFHQGVYTRFRFYPSGFVLPSYPGPTSSSSPYHNGFIAVDYISSGGTPTPTSFPPSPTLPPPSQGSDLCNEAQIFGSSLSYITDTDLVNGVSISYDTVSSPLYIFILNQAAGYNSSVTIKFRLNSPIQAGSTFENSLGSSGILYETTVQLLGRIQ